MTPPEWELKAIEKKRRLEAYTWYQVFAVAGMLLVFGVAMRTGHVFTAMATGLVGNYVSGYVSGFIAGRRAEMLK